ncbi:MAG: crossover junction endodeoxyribonuclease RuvC [Rhodobacteraceae bacterium]|nr:crossover junction endodeoxyribonuclease RuvC [Paracoccaceae bacterium]
MRVLGIDPGLRLTGWGVIEVDGVHLNHVAHGVVRPQGKALSTRLLGVYEGIRAVVVEHDPERAAIEQLFVNTDAMGSMKLVHARAVAMLAAAQAGIVVAEYAPNRVKKLVVGAGHADKDQVAYMVRMHLGGADIAAGDAADALAVAITHALLDTRMSRIQAGGSMAVIS